MKPMYYRRDGTPYEGTPDDPTGLRAWSEDFHDRGYSVVKRTVLRNGRFVSTVWMGLDHAVFGKPMIFETMVFTSGKSMSDTLDQDRYSTEEEAIEGHEAMCRKWGPWWMRWWRT